MPVTGTKFVSVAPAGDRAKRQLRPPAHHPTRGCSDTTCVFSEGRHLSVEPWPSLGVLSSNLSHIRLLPSHHAATIRTSAPLEGQALISSGSHQNRDFMERAVARPSIRRGPGPPGPGLVAASRRPRPAPSRTDRPTVGGSKTTMWLTARVGDRQTNLRRHPAPARYEGHSPSVVFERNLPRASPPRRRRRGRRSPCSPSCSPRPRRRTPPPPVTPSCCPSATPSEPCPFSTRTSTTRPGQ